MKSVPTEKSALVACGISDRLETDAACDEVLAETAPSLAGQTDLAIVFFTGHHINRADAIASAILDALAPRVLLGTSAMGVIGNEFELDADAGLSLFAARLPGADLHVFTDTDFDAPVADLDAETICEVIGVGAAARGVMLIADPHTPLIRTVPAVSEALRARTSDNNGAIPIPIFGGVASAGSRPGENRFLLQDQVRIGGFVGLTFSGPIRLDTLVSQGCRPIGRPLVITGARHNIIQKLGGRPALEVVRSLAGEIDEDDRALLEQGLFIGRVVNEYQDRFGRGDFLIRNLVGLDQDLGYLAVSDFVRVGQTIQFHVRDARTATEDLELLLAAQQLDDAPMGGLLFSCTGRGTRMFDQPHHDAQTIRANLPGLPMAGFFAAGEIGPVGDSSFLHGHTASLALFRSQ